MKNKLKRKLTLLKEGVTRLQVAQYSKILGGATDESWGCDPEGKTKPSSQCGT
jgi:hypothetical protein